MSEFTVSVSGDCGAMGDGRADDTGAFQKALDVFSEKQVPGVIDIPAGQYLISKPLVYRGTPSFGIRIRGSQSGNGPSGSLLDWAGDNDGTVLSLLGSVGCTVEHLAIHCRGKARVGIAVGYDHDRQIGSTNVTLSHLSINAGGGPHSAAVAIGMMPDGSQDHAQVDDVVLDRCQLWGQGPGPLKGTAYGVFTGTDNVKNIALRDSWTIGFAVGVYVPNGSGSCLVTGGGGMGNGADFFLGAGSLAVIGWEGEVSQRLLTTSGYHSAYAAAAFKQCSWFGKCRDDDIALYFCGNLSLEGCYLSNSRVEGATPRVALVAPWNGSATSLDSRQNLYRNAKDAGSLFVNWNGTASLLKDDVAPPWLRSWCDLGGTSGALVSLPMLGGPIVPPPPQPPPTPPRVRTQTQVAIPRGKTSATFEHNLGGQPALEDIGIIPDGPSPVWVSEVTATTITIRISPAAPMAGRKFTVSASRQP